nr:EOG090X076S [Lepidurus arcticus]
MADVLDILELERPGTPEVTKESIIAGGSKPKPKPKPKVDVIRRPEGMHRELFNLLYNDNKDVPPLFPTDTSKGYKQAKAKLGVRKVRPWKWMSFTNPARKDGAVFHHWRRATEEAKEYPFAKFNKQIQVASYTDVEYQQNLQSDSWSRAETDYLMELCRRFDLRFAVINDRWDRVRFSAKTVEELKDRYYEICNALAKARAASHAPEPKLIYYDADHEKRRKEQLKRLYERTTEQMEEEQMLLNELRKIEARKKDRERKTQDLQKLISAADTGTSPVSEATKGEKKQLQRKKTQTPVRAKLDTLPVIDSTGIKFPDFKTSGVSLRSQRMKLPPSVGQKKAKAIEQLLQELGLELNPIATEDICNSFNELRSEMVLLYELKLGLATCDYELQSLRHQYEALVPGKTLELPPGLVTSASTPSLEGSDTPGRVRSISEVIDVVGPSVTPSRKRKAALEQGNMLKKIKNRM